MGVVYIALSSPLCIVFDTVRIPAPNNLKNCTSHAVLSDVTLVRWLTSDTDVVDTCKSGCSLSCRWQADGIIDLSDFSLLSFRGAAGQFSIDTGASGSEAVVRVADDDCTGEVCRKAESNTTARPRCHHCLGNIHGWGQIHLRGF